MSGRPMLQVIEGGLSPARRSFQREAIARDALATGTYSVGKRRVVLEQRFSLCGPHHGRRWRLGDGDGPVVCGECHPPPASLEVVWC